jgi:hypothetical protein
MANTDPYNIYGYTYGYRKPSSVSEEKELSAEKLAPVFMNEAMALKYTFGKSTEELKELIKIE